MLLHAIILLSILTAVYVFRSAGSRPKDFPPGPPTIPILGNLHQMPKEKAWLQFEIWAHRYGPVYSLMLGPSSVMIVVSSDQAVKELLDKRSGIYSSRPPLYIGNLISGWLRMVLMEYGKPWRLMRSLVHDHLNVRASISYTPYQDLENRQMLLGMLEKPGRWVDHLRRYSNALTTQIVFGFRTTSIDDENMHALFEGVENWSTAVVAPQAQLLDIFPILQHLPDILVPAKREAKRLHASELKLYRHHWDVIKRATQDGTANPCFGADMVIAQKKENFSDNEAAYLLGSLHEAGSDTTWSQLLGFMQALLIFPEVVQKAQEELDRVCGDSIPTLEDQPRLQYIRGCVKESLRWMPTVMTGFPRAVIRDDFYMGYRIPKGATVIMNVWALHNNEKRYPNARVFDPSRFANDYQNSSEAAHNPDFSKRDHFTFGVGRRLCQGMHIAERSMFLAIARLLWAFDFKRIKDENGNEIVPDADALTDGVVVHPEEFPIEITARSEKRAQTVRAEWDKVEDKLNDAGQWKRVPEEMFSKEYVPFLDRGKENTALGTTNEPETSECM